MAVSRRVENETHAQRGCPRRAARFLGEELYEVLDATKHQDDKIGRFLTAIAFLFTGSVALALRTDLLNVRVRMDDQLRALAGLFLGGFLILSILAVLILVVALGPNLTLPRGQRLKRSEPSRLFFLSIASQSESEWQSLWYPGRVPPSTVLQTYVNEAHNLAFKTDFKYNRTNEARAFFTLGLLFLGLAIALFLDASARVTKPLLVERPLPILEWDVQTRLWIAAVVASFSFVLAYDYVRLEQEPDNYLVSGARMKSVWPNWIFSLAAPSFVLAVLLPSSGALRVVGFFGVTICVAAAVMAVVARRAGRKSLLWPWGAYAGLGFAWLLATRALMGGHEQLQLLAAFLPIVGLEAPRLLISSRTHQGRMRALRDHRPTGGFGSEWRAWRDQWRLHGGNET